MTLPLNSSPGPRTPRASTLDLTRWRQLARNAGPWHPIIEERLGTLPTGVQTFWGLPFDLGPDERHTWVVLAEDRSPVELELHSRAGAVVFAHFCDLSHDPTGQAQPADYRPGEVVRPGEHLADYVLVYADGQEHWQTIRRRFEIGEAQAAWGQKAFAARPHVEDLPVDWRGPYPARAWGRYQTGVKPGPYWERLNYWLFVLRNPQPQKELACLNLISSGAGRIAVAAITLYHGVEDPLKRSRLQTVQLTLPRLSEPHEVKVDLDLGTVTRLYEPTVFDAEGWLESQPQGWGEALVESQPTQALFLDLMANPEACLKVDGHSVEMRRLIESGSGRSADGQLQVEIVSPQKTWVHVTVADDITGRPTPVRIHFRTPDGRYLPPHGHRHEVNDNWFEDYGGDLKLGSTQYAYVDGRFQIELPVGDVLVEVVKGFEYQPLRQRLTVQPGQRELALTISRRLNWRQQGWVTADTHVHFLSPQTAWLEAEAEGINLVNLLASQWGDLYTNVADLTGKPSGASNDETLIWVGTENRQHMLGHLSLLGVQGEPVHPLCAGGPDESYLGDPTWTSLAEWADACREREGLVVYPHFPNPYCEVAADIVLGKVDAVEIRDFTPALDSYNVREWYRFLNCGYRVAAVGGTDKMSAGMPLGGVRTYAYLGDAPFNFANWASSVRAGRTFTTSGPLLHLQVEGQAPGSEIDLPRGGGRLSVVVRAESVQPLNRVQVIANGRVVAQEDYAQGTTQATLHTSVALTGSAWVAARCMSQLKAWHVKPVHIAAHTSPVYVRCAGQDLFSPSDATFLLTLMEGGLTWLDFLAIPGKPERQACIRQVFQSAQAALSERMRRAAGSKAARA